MNVEIKEFYSAKELSEMELSSLPHFHVNVRRRADKEGWKSRPRTGKGGGLEYAFDGLPKAVQDEITAKHLMAQVKGNAPTVRVSGAEKALVASERDVATLTDKDRTTADCRLLMALLVSRYALEQNLPDGKQITIRKQLAMGSGFLPMMESV